MAHTCRRCRENCRRGRGSDESSRAIPRHLARHKNQTCPCSRGPVLKQKDRFFREFDVAWRIRRSSCFTFPADVFSPSSGNPGEERSCLPPIERCLNFFLKRRKSQIVAT